MHKFDECMNERIQDGWMNIGMKIIEEWISRFNKWQNGSYSLMVIKGTVVAVSSVLPFQIPKGTH